jgi:hypothetical protein
MQARRARRIAEAFTRLLGKWLDAVARDPATASRLPLKYLVTDENLSAVASLDLYREYSPERRRRDYELLRAWQAPRHGSSQ